MESYVPRFLPWSFSTSLVVIDVETSCRGTKRRTGLISHEAAICLSDPHPPHASARFRPRRGSKHRWETLLGSPTSKGKVSPIMQVNFPTACGLNGDDSVPRTAEELVHGVVCTISLTESPKLKHRLYVGTPPSWLHNLLPVPNAEGEKT